MYRSSYRKDHRNFDCNAMFPSTWVRIPLKVLGSEGGVKHPYRSSAVIALGASTLADIYDPHERGTMMGIYYWSVLSTTPSLAC